jgi:hypothetical protein
MLLLEEFSRSIPTLPEVPKLEIPAEILENPFFQYLPYIVAGIILLIVVILIIRWMRKNHTGSYENALQKRKELLRSLDLLERDYLKRKISQVEFQKLFKQKQATLIKFEATIQNHLHKQSKDDKKYLQKLPPKKRHVATELLQHRKQLLDEMGIAKKRFLQMKIDSPTYQQLMEKLHIQMIEVRAKLHELGSADNVRLVMSDLKQKLKDIDREEKMKQSDREKQVVEEVVQHLEELRYLQ